MSDLLQIRVTRRTALMLSGSVLVGSAIDLVAAEDSPFNGAIAFWNMADLNGGAGDNPLVPHGDVKVGIALSGNDKRTSLREGGDGYSAVFNAGWLDAGQDANGDLNVKGRGLTIAIRLVDRLSQQTHT